MRPPIQRRGMAALLAVLVVTPQRPGRAHRGGGRPPGGFGGGNAMLASTSSQGSTQRPGLQPEVVAADLLEPRTNTRYLFIDGLPIEITSKHEKLYKEFRDRKRAVITP